MKEGNLKRHVLWDSNDMTFWKRQNYGDSRKISVCCWKWWGRWLDRAQRGFSEVKILCDISVMDSCYYTFVQTHRMYTTKSEPWCKLWTLDDGICQCRFILYNKVPFYCGLLLIGEAAHVWRPGYVGNLCTFLSLLLQT